MAKQGQIIETPADIIREEKDDLLVQYAMHNISSKLFVSKYQLYLPNREGLQALIDKQLQNDTRE